MNSVLVNDNRAVELIPHFCSLQYFNIPYINKSQFCSMSLGDTLYSTFTNKCPRCHAAKVFENNNPYSFKNGLTMRKTCVSCGLKYEREVGYFYGSMYVSYGMQTGLVTAMYLLNIYWWNMSSLALVFWIIGFALVLFPVTFRWSRILWIGFFTKYEPDYKGHAWNDRKEK